jgi:hypothetical protein
MRFESISMWALLTTASLALAGCGGGDSTTPVAPTPIFSAGTTSSSAVPLTPVPAVQATGGANFSNMTTATTFPALSATMTGYTGVNPSMTAPSFDLTGASMQITYDPGVSFIFSKSSGGTTYVDTYGSGTFGIDQWHVVKELQVSGLTNAYSAFVYYVPSYSSEILDYTQFGFWSRDTTSEATNSVISSYVAGYVTPTASVPATGSATFVGRTIGAGVRTGYDGTYLIRGAMVANANFAAGTVATSFTDVVGTNSLSGISTIFSNFGGTANIAGGAFSGPVASTATTGTILGGTGTLSGTLVGQFYGPNAEEIGGIWSLTGGGGWNATGSFGGQQ